jgi:F0F1-type ATP synthase membrane subunit a
MNANALVLLTINIYLFINNMLSSNGNVFTETLPGNGRCLQSHHLATDLNATAFLSILVFTN